MSPRFSPILYPFCVFFLLKMSQATPQQVIDIFTNYPNTKEAMEDYSRILQGRNFIGKRLFNVHDYTDHRHHYHHNPYHHSNEEVLESEFGVFQDPDEMTDDSGFGGAFTISTTTAGYERPAFETQKRWNATKYHHQSLEDYYGNQQQDNYDDADSDEDSGHRHPDRESLRVTNILRRFLVRMHRRQRRPFRNDRSKNKRFLANRDWLLGNDDNSDANEVWGEHSYEQVQESQDDPKEHKFLGALKDKAKKHLGTNFLSLFTVIQFDNFRCTAQSATSSQYEGTCYLADQCAALEGVAMGDCAAGYGVCCVFRGTCGGMGSQNCTYFESPGYPSYYPTEAGTVSPTLPPTTTTTRNPLTPDPRLPPQNTIKRTDSANDDIVEPRQEGTYVDLANALSCVFRVQRTSNKIQRMRIDFIDLELRGPNMNGDCVDERLIITGVGINANAVPVICGYNSGQHVYVDVSTLSGPLQISILANMIESKRFQLRICQYADGCPNFNCLQYYEGVTGLVSSFNYDQAAMFSRSTPGYLNNLNYAICIKREPGYCTITYSVASYPFQLRNYEGDTLTVPMGQAGAGVINCPDDYIVIDGIRLCGDRLNDGSVNGNFSQNAPVTDLTVGPIVIPVRTNGARNGRGFKLAYMQNRCPSTGGTPNPRL